MTQPSSTMHATTTTTTTSSSAFAISPGKKPQLTQPLPLPNHNTSSTSSSSTTTPRLVYGTAWKKSRTSDLVHAALRAGFRGIDTANQPRHYQESLVGQGISRALADGTISSRKEIFIQTKFTSPAGQDPPPNCPYDPSDPLEKQVRDSVEASFLHLFGDGDDSGYIDSLVLHSPMETYADTFAVWGVLESYVPHRIGHLGIANAPIEVVERLWHETTTTTFTDTDTNTSSSPSSQPGVKLSVPPSIVQNRFYAATQYDTDLRALCREKGMVYQSFWTLTANGARARLNLVDSAPVKKLAAAVGRSSGGQSVQLSSEVAYYSLVLGLEGITILDGTTSEAHMREDLDGLALVERFAAGGEDGERVWSECLAEFKELIGEEE